MHSKFVTLAAGALVALTSAIPVNKRDLVWVTEIETATETVAATTTLWVDPPAETHGRFGHGEHGNEEEAPAEAPAQAPETTPAPDASGNHGPSYAPKPDAAADAAEPAAEPASEPASPASSTHEAPAPAASSEENTPAPEPTTAPAPEPTPEAEPKTTSAAPAAPVSSYEAPAPSSEAAPSSSASFEPAQKATSDSSSSSDSGVPSGSGASGTSYTGELTYFTPGMGSCGHTSTESDKMVAISHTIFDEYTPNGNPNKNPLCGATVTIEGADGGSFTAKIWDRCTGCAAADLDMPQEFFNEVTSKGGKPADGRAHGIKWSFD